MIYPFTAIVGQESLKLALVLNVINPKVGGVLIRGEKGTAKSTAVRALADLMPEIRVIARCPFRCRPDHPAEMCERCRSQKGKPEIRKVKVPVVTLPLNATEDRVVGGMDFERTLRTGRRSLQPGVLAEAHGGILYIDEVNLLDDHLVDLVLDVAASGINRIEREGISFVHASRFLLVGTMNPEEGELRPQLLDRFGLCVEVRAEEDPAKRVVLMERREAFDQDPEGFTAKWSERQKEAAERIQKARTLLPSVRFPAHLRSFVSELCRQSFAAGHRADLVMEQAARALAAWKGRRTVRNEDILETAPMVLIHRRRDAMPPPPQAPPPPPQDSSGEEKTASNPSPARQTPDDTTADAPPRHHEAHPRPEAERDTPAPQAPAPEERVFRTGSPFRVRPISYPKDRRFRRGSGRRSRTRTAQKQGRYIKSTLVRRTGDIAFDATLRAAAPHQKHRTIPRGLKICLLPEDLREKIRERRIGNFLLFLVDASGSMGARGRMVACKGAILSLLLDAYQKRDRVAMISFRKTEAVLNLPPTSSVELAGKMLAELPVGGRTPLSAGLAEAYRQIRNHLLRDPSARPIVIVVTDGKSNVALTSRKPLEEALDMAAKMASLKDVHYVVVDTEPQGPVAFGLAARLAACLNADYFRIEDLKAQDLVKVIKERP